MNILFRTLGLVLCLICLPVMAGANSAMESDSAKKRDGLPEALESALTQLLSATKSTVQPKDDAVAEVLRFVTGPAPKKAIPEARPDGSGIIFRDTIGISLKTLMSYILDPKVPGEALYPNSVRRNAWAAGSGLLTRADAFLASPLPPTQTLTMHAVEEEETTPDESSGCIYEYKLNRLFILTGYEGRTALFSISQMPTSSNVGRKGIIVGKDSQWNYVYTTEEGTNLAMLGWAETHLYGSASVTVYLSGTNADSTDIISFKWAKAGWAGSNVVKPSHIRAGLERFTSGLKQVLQSPRRPTVDAIKARMAELNGMDDAALRAALQPYVNQLHATNDKALSGEFGKALEDPAYLNAFTRKQLIADLIKNFVREKVKP